MEQFPHYPVQFIMRSKDPESLRIIDLWKFKSKKNRWYIVEIEHFTEQFIAVKFYCKAMRHSPCRYSLMTNDNEPRTIVYSCLEVVRQYLCKNPMLSFGFVAAEDIEGKKRKDGVNRRFSFYRMVMVQYFGTRAYFHFNDTSHRVYLMLSKRSIAEGSFTIDDIVNLINQSFNDEFCF